MVKDTPTKTAPKQSESSSEDHVSSDGTRTYSQQQRFFKTQKRLMNVWTIIGSILILAVVIYLMGILSVPVGIIIWTAIFVFVLRTPVNFFERHGIKRAMGTTLAYIIMVIVVALLALLLFSPVFGIGEQFKNLIESIPGYVQSITEWYNTTYDQYSHFFQDDTVKSIIEQITGAVSAWASELAKSSAEGIVSIGSGVANSALAIGFALVVAFWILMDLPALGRECKRLIGKKREEDARMLHLTFTRVMGGYIKATIVQCILIGFGCTVAYAVIGIPNFAALGGIAGILNIIPVIGPWLGGGVAALVGVFVSPLVAILALVLTIVIQQFVYTFVSPKLMADSVNVHPAMVFIALFAGSALGGAMGGLMGSLLGMLASIPAVAAAKAIFVYYFEKRTGRNIVAEDGVFFKGNPNDLLGTGKKGDAMGDISALGISAHEKAEEKEHKPFWQRLFKVDENVEEALAPEVDIEIKAETEARADADAPQKTSSQSENSSGPEEK